MIPRLITAAMRDLWLQAFSLPLSKWIDLKFRCATGIRLVGGGGFRFPDTLLRGPGPRVAKAARRSLRRSRSQVNEWD